MAEKKTFAIIRSGNRQYLVSPGMRVKIEKIAAKEGEGVSFDEVLLAVDGEKVLVGTPVVSGAKVSAKVLRQAKHPKQVVFKMKPKKRYRVKTGHRQPFTEVEIQKINL